MGHYASEMGYEGQNDREELIKESALRRLAANIEKDIHERGLPRVLAEMLSEPILYKVHKS